MFEGKMFLGLTGMPMRNSVLANIVLAEAEPEPFTVANLMTKSLVPLIPLNLAWIPPLPIRPHEWGEGRGEGQQQTQRRWSGCPSPCPSPRPWTWRGEPPQLRYALWCLRQAFAAWLST